MTKCDRDSRRWSPWKSEDSEEEDAVVIDSGTNKMPRAVQPLKQRKATAPRQPQLVGQPPTERNDSRRECTPSELIDTAAKFQQRARKSILTWLVHLRDTGRRWGGGEWEGREMTFL